MDVHHGNDSAPASLSHACPAFSAHSDYVLDQVVYWVEGVGLCAVATFGVVGNLVSCVVLSQRELRSAFNMLLIALALFDTCYIASALLETVRKGFHAATTIHIWLFPLVLYPGQMIALTGSVFMVVAIAFERYVSVHYPLDYNKAMNDPAAIRTRLIKYLVPVLLLSVLFNIPKFLETEVVHVPINDGLDYELQLNVTAMRINPVYSTFVNWSQLFVLGIIPVCMLAYFNAKIYRDVRERERRRRPLAQRTSPPSLAAPTESRAHSTWKRLTTMLSSRRPSLSPSSLSGNNGLASPSETSQGGVPHRHPSGTPSAGAGTAAAAAAATVGSAAASGRVFDPSRLSNARRRRVEDRLAVLFMGIVAVYLICHFPRVLLNFYEMLVIEQAMACNRLGLPAFDVWAQILASVSHFLLVTNSSINILIYSLFNTQFRETACRLVVCAFHSVSALLTVPGMSSDVNGAGTSAAAAAVARRRTEMTLLLKTEADREMVTMIVHNGQQQIELEPLDERRRSH